MGHKHAATFQHYLSSFSNVDGQSIMLGRPEEQNVVDRLISMASHVDLNAPKPHGSSLVHIGRQNKRTDLQLFRNIHREYFESDKAFQPEIPQPDSGEDERNTSYGTLTVVKRPPASRMLRTYLQWDVDRSAVIDVFYHHSSRCLQLEEVVKPLVSIACPERSIWRYPKTEITKDGRCYRCNAPQKR